MTRKEFIIAYNIGHRDGKLDEYLPNDYPEFIEQEPCEDCISREETIKPFLVDSMEEWTSADVVKYLKSLLLVMPTMIYPQVPEITPIVILDEEEQGDIQYDNKTTLNKW